MLAYELVLPNGTVTEVTDSSNPDLFFGLRVRKDCVHNLISASDFLYNQYRAVLITS